MNELNEKTLRIILDEVQKLQREHPKANVTYDTERHGINITYPLPRDYFKLSGIRIENRGLEN